MRQLIWFLVKPFNLIIRFLFCSFDKIQFFKTGLFGMLAELKYNGKEKLKWGKNDGVF